MSRSPNYILRDAYRIDYLGDLVELPAGTFVRPIHIDYVPKHVMEERRHRYFSPTTETFCYTRFGIVAIPNELIKET